MSMGLMIDMTVYENTIIDYGINIEQYRQLGDDQATLTGQYGMWCEPAWQTVH